jgi:thioredoxin 1
MSENIIYVSDDSFEKDVLQSDKPVLLDFWATWCHPCKMIAPVLEDLGKDYAGRVVIAKMDIDENPQTPAKFGVRRIPTLMLFKGGVVEKTVVGAKSKGELAAFLDALV